MLKNIKSEKIALLGLGLENQALLSFLNKKYKNLDITICDAQSEKLIKKTLPFLKHFSKLKWQTENKFNTKLEKFTLLFRSPGWPINCPGVQKALKNGVKMSSPMNIFFETCPSKNIIGISGTKGKGTTASLIYKTIIDSGKKCFLGGNIGVAPLSFIHQIKKNDWIVLELSSFQLEDLKYSPKIAVLTNIFKEHLSPADPNNPNFHKNIYSYLTAKLNLVLNQNKNDYFIVNKKLEKKIKPYQIESKIIYFSASKTKSNLVGNFNQENVGATEEVAKILKIKKDKYIKTINNFSNLSHRLEFVKEINEIKYYDNSFSTTPESTELDLKSFQKNIILLAGGADKKANFKNLAKEIKKRVKIITLFKGLGSQKIKQELLKINYPKEKIFETPTMKEAIKIVNKYKKKGDIVLLSTACASFGSFKNYKERGDLFQKEVKTMKL
jgi:UDP-N-acetylmuramoylalanine--D-glutamate ligase